MKLYKRINSREGSVLIWVMVALLVISLLTALVLTMSSRFFTSTKERSLDSQAYHSAYSMSRSIANWIESYDPNIPATSTKYPAEKEKIDFINALAEATKDGTPVIIDATDAQKAGGGSANDLVSTMGTVIAELTYEKVDDVATINIITTSEFEGRKSSVEAVLQASLAREPADTKANSVRFEPPEEGPLAILAKKLVEDMENIESGNWVEKVKNKPAYAGRTAGNMMRYYTLTEKIYQRNTVLTPYYFYLNPNVAGNPASGSPVNSRTNRLLYYATPGTGDRAAASNIDFLRNDQKLGSSETITGLTSARLDLKIMLDPEGSMLDESFLPASGDGQFTLKDGTSIGLNTFFGGQNKLLQWPPELALSKTAPTLFMADTYAAPVNSFTFFDKPGQDPATDGDYIFPRYVNSGVNFRNSGTTNPWSPYYNLYIYMLNDSDKYCQITGAVSVDKGLIFTRRDFLIGGRFEDSKIVATTGTNPTYGFEHLQQFPTMIRDTQLYFASPKTPDKDKKLESVIQATPGIDPLKGKNYEAPIHKTRINGGWIVVQDRHTLTISDTLINTQKEGVTVNLNEADIRKNGTETREVSFTKEGTTTTIRSDLNIDPDNPIVTGIGSGNDIYVSDGGELVLGKGTLICSDIYLDEGATLTFPAGSDAVIYGNIYSKGTINLDSDNIKIYGKASEEIHHIDGSTPSTKVFGGGIFNYAGGKMTTKVSADKLENLFPNNKKDGQERLMGIHSFMEFDASNSATKALREFVDDNGNDQTDSKGVCTHFDTVTGGNFWQIVRFDDV